MNKLKENLACIIILLIEFTFIFHISEVCYNIIDVGAAPLLGILLFSIVCAFLLFKGLKLILQKRWGRVSLLLLLIFLIIVCIELGENANFIDNNFMQNIIELNGKIANGRQTDFKDYIPLMLVIGPVISLIFIIVIKSDIMELCVIINLGVFLFYYYIGYEKEVMDLRLIFGFINIFILFRGGYERSIKKLKSKGTKVNINKEIIISQIILFSILVPILFSDLTKDNKGFYYDRLSIKTRAVLKNEGSNELLTLSDNEDGISNSGYIDTDKKLGGPLNISKESTLKVYSKEGNLYLRGAVKDIYTGSSWTRSGKHSFATESPKKYIDDNINPDDYNKAETIQIEPVNETYTSYFTPLNTRSVNIEPRYSVYWNKENNLYRNDKRIKSRYDVQFYRELDIDKFSNYEMEYQIKAKKEYLYLPESIPDRVYKLAHKIGDKGTTRLDKINLIKEYLSKNYVYDTNTSEVPPGVDFVDYFLFTEKKGYCVYFATSFAVLARINGIEARYVEGFKTSNVINSDGFIDVTNEDAHAWVEVMLDPEKRFWSTVDCSPTARSQQPLKVEEKKSEEQSIPTVNTKSQNQNEKNSNINEKSDLDNEKSSIKHEEKKKLNIKGLRYPRRFLVSAFLAGILLFMFFKFLKAISLRRDAIKKKSVMPLYRYILKRLKSIGVVKEKSQTEKEFISRIDNISMKKQIDKLVDEVYSEVYGNQIGEFKNRKEFLKEFEEYIKSHSGKLEYILKKYYKN